MWLNNVWYVLFVVIVAGYLIMDGFDLGVGIQPEHVLGAPPHPDFASHREHRAEHHVLF